MCKECDYIERIEYYFDKFKEGEIGNADLLIGIKNLLKSYPDEDIPQHSNEIFT